MTRSNARLRWLGPVLAVALVTTCEPDEVQNSANEAVVMAQFFVSQTNRVPVAGVRMVVESPGDRQDQTQGRPYNGPDILAISGDDGIAIARVFPGFEDSGQNGEGGGGGDEGSQGQGPENPLDLPPALIFADVAITFIHQGRIVPFIESGFTIGSGRLYDLGPIFLDELGLAVE